MKNFDICNYTWYKKKYIIFPERRNNMRKIILFIVGIISVFIPTKLLAAPAVIDWQLDRSVFVHRIINGEYHLNNMPYLTANGNIVYCIEPGLDLDKGGTMESTENISDTSVSKDITRASLIGYYGYQKFGHNDPKYYMAAQKLIWLEMGASSVKYTSDREGNSIIDTTWYENEILKMVNNHNRLPEFNFDNYYLVGDEVVLSDNNNVLKNYEVIKSKGNVTIDGNNIKIDVVENANNFTLRTKSDNSKTVYYYKSGMQTVASFGFPYAKEKEYHILTTRGKITLTKKDYDKNDIVPYNDEVSLQGALYGLYNESGEQISQNETDEYGSLMFTNLAKGTYIIKELKPSLGYTLADDITVIIDKDNLDLKVDSCEKVIKGKVKLTKLLDDYENNTTTLEPNITFVVYDISSNLIDEKTTDNNGNITFDLPYGTYIVKQLTNIEGITNVEDFEVSIKNDDEILEYVLVNRVIPKKVIQSLPRTGKKDYLPFLLVILCLLLIKYNHEKKYI